MKLLAKIVLWVAGVYLGVMLITGLAAKLLLSSSRIQAVLSSLKSSLPVAVTASGGDFDLVQWFLFRPAITVDDLSIGNPPGFSSQPLLQAKGASTQVALLSLLRNRIEIRSLALRAPQMRIERDRNGRSNIEILLAALSGPKPGAEAAPPGEAPGRALSIQAFLLKSGTIRYVESGAEQPSFTIRDLDLALTDFAADKTCNINLQAGLFTARSSRVGFQGRAGPFQPQSVAAQGDLSLVLAPAEIPPALRREHFGDLLGDPGGSSRVRFQAAMQGDLTKALRGQGKLSISGLQLGRDSKNRVGLDGEVPLQLTVVRFLTSPSFELSTQKASLQLGEGKWAGQAQGRYDGSRFEGSSSGAITGVRMNEMLGAFTTANNAVFGRAAIPDYRLLFAGGNARQIRDSLAGAGTIQIEDGRIALFDLLGTVQQHVKKMLSGAAPAPGATNFIRFASRFEIQDGQVRLPELVLENSSSRVTGQGRFTFNHVLDFDLDTTLTGETASLLGGRPDSSGQTSVAVPVKVSGTVESPKIYPDLRRLATRKATEKAKSLFESIFKKKP